jgi:hypothetical protein
VDEWAEWPPLPKVKFTVKTADGRSKSVAHVVEPANWDIEVGGRTVSTRLQVPLRLAWGISIHKSQGMTISDLEVNLGGLFEYGQAYVALSRATDLEGLRISNFNPTCIRASDTVRRFYEALMSQSQASSPRREAPPTTEASFVAGTLVRPYRDAKTDADGWITRRASQPVEQDLDSDFGAVRHGGLAPTLTREQKERAERNKARALARRNAALRAAMDPQQPSSQPSPTKYTDD